MTDYIRIISRASNWYGDKLIEFMDTFGLSGLMYATQAQAKEFVEKYLEVKR